MKRMVLHYGAMICIAAVGGLVLAAVQQSRPDLAHVIDVAQDALIFVIGAWHGAWDMMWGENP